MKKIITTSILTLAVLLSQSASAWVFVDNVKIQHLVTYEDPVGKTVVLFGNDATSLQCYIPVSESNLTAMVLSAFMAGKALSVHCYDVEENVGGYPSHKLHRMIIR